jgi:hypothetical protein
MLRRIDRWYRRELKCITKQIEAEEKPRRDALDKALAEATTDEERKRIESQYVDLRKKRPLSALVVGNGLYKGRGR